ncbi:MFS transporter [Enterococcus gallinarum]|uniref:MFS transporter n=1 Tax=Enterococcus gallinarum TaxID=1353 RepID=UPI0012E2FFF3|nr:MFS transporter [Enterococcus gallinarum]MUN91216.1 MFS transporter [Enterococcus gallinarum]
MEVKTKFQVIYFSQYAIMAILMTQIVPFLTEQGYGSIQRGWFLASYSVTTILFQIVLGYLSDRNNRLKRISMTVSSLLVLFVISFYLLGKEQWVLHLASLAIGGGLANTAATLLDNWVLSEPPTARHLSYIKAIGSLGWSTMSLLIPLFIVEADYRLLSLPLMVLLGVTLFVSKDTPEAMRMNFEPAVEQAHTVQIKDILALCKSKPFLLYNSLFFLLYLTIVANNTLVIDKLITMTNGKDYVGLKWSIQSFCEIPAYLLLNKTITKWKNERLVMISGVFLTVQFFLFYLADRPLILLGVSFLQFFTVPVFTIGSRLLISQITPRAVFSSGQLISVSFYIGCSSFLSPLLSGIVSNALSIDQTILLFGLLPILAFILYKVFTTTKNI